MALISFRYDTEKVDDTCSQFCSMGTGNDCDDFAVATCSLVTSIIQDTSPPSTNIGHWIKENVLKVYAVSGEAWPKMQMDIMGKKKTCGHMWCELFLKDGSRMVVECTSAVAYYGGDVVCGNARVGNLEEYLERVYYWDSERGYSVDSGQNLIPLDVMPLPEWVSGLRYGTPDKTFDSEFRDPGPPPALVAITGYDVSRDMSNDKALGTRILPFTRSRVKWHQTGFNSSLHHDGAYD